MLCGYPHLRAVASLLLFWRCPRPCLLASMLALPTFALTLANKLSDRQNGRRKALTRSRASRSWQSLAHLAGRRFVYCPFAPAGALPVVRRHAKHQPVTSNCAPKSWQSLAHRARPMTKRLSNTNHDGCPLARAGALLVLHRCAGHNLPTSNRVPKSCQSLAHDTGPQTARMSKQMSNANHRRPASGMRARRGLELVRLPNSGEDRQSVLAMCVDVEPFQYEAQSAAASAVGSGACAPTCAPHGRQCLAVGPSSLHPSSTCLPQPCRRPILSSPSRPLSILQRFLISPDANTPRLRDKPLMWTVVAVYLRSIFPCLLYTSPSPRDRTRSRMPSSA